MAIYELRTYTLFVGKIQEASEIYKELGTPWINKFKKNLVNYYLGAVSYTHLTLPTTSPV